jgi:transposase InsO family protein
LLIKPGGKETGFVYTLHRLTAKIVIVEPKKYSYPITPAKPTITQGEKQTQRMIRTINEELFSLREWESERELINELDEWIDYYNRNYLHSAHGYRTPVQVEEEYYRNHG